MASTHPPSIALLALLRRQLDAARKSSARTDDHSIHAARKQLKRVRAGLRLLRTALGDARYRNANRHLRDAAVPLRAPRDAAALREALRKLAHPSDAGATRATTARWRRQLAQEHRLARSRHQRDGGSSSADLIGRGHRQLLAPPRHPDGSDSICRGIRRSYRHGRRAWAAARRNPTIERLHEWRKQARYLENELGLARELLPLGMRKSQRSAARLAALLGDDHDLALLRERLCAQPAHDTSRLVRRIERRRSRLQAEAFRLARRLYRRSPPELGAHLERALRRTRAARADATLGP